MKFGLSKSSKFIRAIRAVRAQKQILAIPRMASIGNLTKK